MAAKAVLCDAERPAETDPLLIKEKKVLTKSSGSFWCAPSACKEIQELCDEYGSELLWLIAGGLWFIKGMLGSMESSAAKFIYKDYHSPAAQMQIYHAVSVLPWSMKPVFGLLSDTFPIGGYNKFPYASVVSALGLLCMTAVGMTSVETMPVCVFTGCLFLSNTFQSFITVLIQGMYSARLQRSSDESLRSNLVTFDHAGTAVGLTFGALFVGFMLRFFDARHCFIVLAVPSALVTGWILKVFLKEERKNPAEMAVCWERCKKQPELVFLCMFILAANVIFLFTNMIAKDPLIVGVVAVLVVLAMAVALMVLLTPVAAGIACFIAIVSTSSFEYGGASFYFCTNSKVQYPAGPHLSPVFFTGVPPMIHAGFWLLGMLIFTRASRGWTYRQWLPRVSVLVLFAQVPQVVFYSRLNIVMGIDDRIWMIAAEAVDGMASSWVQMPLIIAISTLCPCGLEATVYGILIGMLNLSDSASSSLGSLVLHVMGVNPSGSLHESAEFDRFWQVVALKPVMGLLAALLLTPALPQKVIGASLIDPDSGSITKGSLWKRWLGGSTG